MKQLKKAVVLPALVVLATAILITAWWRYQQTQVRDVPILMYHGIGDNVESVWWVRTDDFKKQLRYLKDKGYTSILPADLVSHRKWGKPLPAKPVIITFDDGYTETVQNAEPLMKNFGFRGVVYLPTDIVTEDSSKRRSWEGVPVVTWPEVRDAHRRGILTFGGHSKTHRDLSSLEDPYSEIRGCYRDIRKKGGFVPAGFCYPHGQHTPKIAAAVRRAGFSTAVTSAGEIYRTDSAVSLLELPRLSVYGGEQGYHAEVVTLTSNSPAVSIRIWKDGFAVPSFPRLKTPGAGPNDGWKDQVKISQTPATITWHNTGNKPEPPFLLELWGDGKLLPQWKTTLPETH